MNEMNSPCILIVEDEIDLAQLIKTSLHKEGFSHIDLAHTITDGWEQFNQNKPSLAILDIMLPDGEGYDLCKKIREISHVPILFLSAKSDEVDKVLGLAIGGDDYITKPFSPKELAYRVKAHLRRSGVYATETEQIQPKKKQIGIFTMNTEGTEFFKAGENLQ